MRAQESNKVKKKTKNIQSLIFYLIILLNAFLLDFGMQNWVTALAYRVAGEQELIIRMADTDENNDRVIQILYEGTREGDEEELFSELKKAVSDNTNWSFSEGKIGEAWTLLETGVRGAEISVKVKPSVTRYILFHMAPYNGVVEIICDGRIQKIDMHRYSGAATRRIYPFRNVNSVNDLRAIAHIALFVIIFFALYIWLKRGQSVKIKEIVRMQSVVYLILIAFLFVGTLKDHVNHLIVSHLLPQSEVTVSLKQESDVSIGTSDIRIPINESDYLERKALSDSEYQISVHMTKVPECYIQVDISDKLKRVDYEINGMDYTYEITDSDREAGFCRIYPFASTMSKVFLSILIYVILVIIMTCLFVLIHAVRSDMENGSAIVRKVYATPVVCFFFVFLAVYSIGMYQYINKIDLPHYMPGNLTGDQYGYWYTYIFKDGFINFDIDISSFRGYTNYFLPSVSHLMGTKFHIDPVKIYLVFPALMFAWLTAIIVPELYEIVTNKKPGVISVVLFFLIFTYYNKAYITLATTDFYNNVLFFASIVYSIKAYRKNSILYSVIAGLTLSWMINMHYNFLIYILIVTIGYPLCIMVKKILSRKEITIRDIWKEQRRKIRAGFSKKRAVCLILAVICFLMLCMPQAIINYKSDHIGLFPYDSEHAYAGYPVSWSMWNTFLSYGMVLWPRFIGDDQLSTMKSQLYDMEEILNPAQAMDVYANSPIETAVMVAKKMFTVFDYKSNVQYGEEITWRETKGLIFSYFNYMILLVGLYILIRDKDLSFSAKTFFWLILFATIATAMAGHVEQRVSMTFYIILCMLFTYIFCGEMFEDKEGYKELCDSGLYRFLAFGELLCFGISMTMWA